MKSKRKKQKKQSRGVMKKSILKIVVLLLVMGLNWAGLLAVGKTLAYFNDTENSLGNSYEASSLDFALTNRYKEGFIGMEALSEIEFASVVMKKTGSLNIQYEVNVEKISGDDDFCNALQIELEHNGIEEHDGSLVSVSVPVTTDLGTWEFELDLPVSASYILHGAECNIDLVFKAWRLDTLNFEDSGFSDEERIELRLKSRMIVLNEFLPKPNGEAYGFDFGDDNSDMPRGEWVELYNNSDVEYSLDGWYIWDDSGNSDNKIYIDLDHTSGTTISGKGWLVVYMNKEVLDNAGDTVKLFNGEDVLVDSYIYSGHNHCEIEPTPGEENSDTFGGTSCGDVPDNKSYARLPDGTGYWVDPIPTPGGPNINDNNNYSLLQQQIEPKDDITFSELVEEFMSSNGGTGEEESFDEIVEEIVEDIIVELSVPDIDIPDIDIIETTTPSTEEVIVMEEPAFTEVSVDEEEPIIEEEPEPEPLPAEAPSGAEEGDPEPPLESSQEDQTGQAEPLKESDPEPEPEPEPEPDPEPDPEPEPQPEPEPEPELNNNDNIENEENI